MKKIGIVAIVLITLLIAAGAYAMGDLYVSGTWRYKTTVVIETPEGLRTGSAVREVSNSASSIKLGFSQATNPAKAIGEAVVVDLGKRGKLFALMSGYKWGPDYAHSILYDVFPSERGGTTPEGIRFYKNLKAGPKVLTLEQYPVLVTFRDINDPKTVAPVLELSSNQKWPPAFSVKADHFQELFGEGVRLKEITIEMTDEPVTWGVVDKIIPKAYDEEYRAWRIKLPYGDLRAVNRFDFQRKGI